MPARSCAAYRRSLPRTGAVCTYLMSEVAPTIYERLGYVARPVLNRRYPARASGAEPQVQWLSFPPIPEALLPQPSDALTLKLDADFVHWHIERGLFHAACGRTAPDLPGGPQRADLGPVRR